MNPGIWWMIAASTMLVAACGSASGTLAVAASGEQAAVEGWPFEADGEVVAMDDGWSIEMERVLVSVDELTLAGADGERAAVTLEPVVFDLHDGPTEIARFDAVPARRWERLDYRVSPPRAGARASGSVTDADVAHMIASGISMLLEARATHPEHGAFEISLGVPITISNERCEKEDGTDGVVVPASGVAQIELTFHLDHVFFDSYGEREPALRFEAWAAAAGDDRVVTLEDLASQPLADLRGLDGAPLRDPTGTPLAYDPGPSPLSSPDLRSFVLAAIATTGHLDGEGHCAYRVE